MKSFFRIYLLAVVLISYCGTTYAQKGNRQRLTREQLAEVQAKHIAEKMSMDEATTRKFIDTYSQYQKEIWALGPRAGKPYHPDSAAMTDEEAEQMIKERFDHSRKILGIRQKYYNEYGKFLTQKQIQRVYVLEKQMMMRLASPGKNRDSHKK